MEKYPRERSPNATIEKGGGTFAGIKLLLCENPLPPIPEAIKAAAREFKRLLGVLSASSWARRAISFDDCFAVLPVQRSHQCPLSRSSMLAKIEQSEHVVGYLPDETVKVPDRDEGMDDII